ncbi:ATPase inhibitor [Savitreella phatthalungensis]
MAARQMTRSINLLATARRSGGIVSRVGGGVRGYADAPAGSVAGSGDAFSKREKAAEDKYFRDREASRNEALRKHIKEQRSALDELEKSIGKDDAPQVGKI